MSKSWVRWVTALVSLLAMVAGLWAVGAGWDLRTVHRHAVSARQQSMPAPGEVVGRTRIAGVELDVVAIDTGTVELTTRLLPPATDRPAVGDGIHARVVTPQMAQFGQPLYAADYVRGASDPGLAALGRRGMSLLVVGFALAILGAFALSAALYFLWPDPKRRTRWHHDRYGT